MNNIDHLVNAIIVANLTIFSFWQIATHRLESLKQLRIYRQLMYDHFTVSYDGVFNRGLYHTLLTSTFSHMDILHLGSNMIALKSYSSIAKHLDPTKFLYLYLGGGVVSSLCYVMYTHIRSSFINWSNQTTSLPIYRALGASGAISAIYAWNVFRAPNEVVDIVIYGKVIKMKRIEYGALMFSVDVIGMITDISIPLTFEQLILKVVNPRTIGYAAHVGGALYGAALSFFI